MLSGLILENFKAFRWRQEIPFAPLTLIFGPNSAGKSSILQALLLLKQTAANVALDDVILQPQGSLIDLGSFREMVFHDKETDRICEITPMLKLETDQTARLPMVSMVQAARGDPTARLGFGIRAGYDQDRQTIAIDALPVYLGDTSEPAYTLRPLWSALEYLDTLTDQNLRLVEEEGESERVRARLYEVSQPYNDLIAALQSGSLVEPRQQLSRYALPVDLVTSHPVWRALYANFEEVNLPKIVARLWDPEEVSEGFMGHAEAVWREFIMGLDKNERESWLQKYTQYDLNMYLPDVFKKTMHYGPLLLQSFLVGERPESLESLMSGDILPPNRSASTKDQKILAYLLRDCETIWMPNLAILSLEAATVLRTVLDRMAYLGPLREYPERHHIFGGSVPRNVGKSGLRLADILLAQEGILGRTNQTLDRFGIGYQLEIHRLQDSKEVVNDVFALRLVDPRRNLTVSMRDVGFGVSQVLPVIVQSVLARNQCVLIEQPELHLHPALQAELADVFIESALGPNRNTFLLETHSEHLILRIMRRMRDTVRGTLPDGLPPVRREDVAILYVQPTYVQPTDLGSVVRVLELDEEGELLDPWPGGFFEEGFRERFA